jgi:hypothetical protein
MSPREHSHHAPSPTSNANASPPLEPQTSFWGSKAGLVTIGFLLVAAFFLLSEHWAHALGVLPYLIILACPLLHMFMHGGHGRHASGPTGNRNKHEGA